jgi:hypothetical protein
MSISVSKQSLQIAKPNLSNFDENSVISFLIEILRHLKALSTLLDTPNVVHVDFSVETIRANRKTRSFKFRRKLCHFVPDRDTTALKRSFHHHCTRRTYCMSISVSKQSLQFAKRNLSNFDENPVISILIEMFRRLRARFAPFYTPNVLHVYFSVGTIPANSKTQSFKFR